MSVQVRASPQLWQRTHQSVQVRTHPESWQRTCLLDHSSPYCERTCQSVMESQWWAARVLALESQESSECWRGHYIWKKESRSEHLHKVGREPVSPGHSISTKLAGNMSVQVRASPQSWQRTCQSRSEHLHKVGREHALLTIQLSPLPVSSFRHHGTQNYFIPSLEKNTTYYLFGGTGNYTD